MKTIYQDETSQLRLQLAPQSVSLFWSGSETQISTRDEGEDVWVDLVEAKGREQLVRLRDSLEHVVEEINQKLMEM